MTGGTLAAIPTYHVLLRAGAADKHTVATGAGDVLVGLRLDGAPGDDRWRVNESVWDTLGAFGLRPTQDATDFFRVATAAYCADLLVPHETAFDRWSRDIVLHIPVSDPARWKAVDAPLRELLGFLTGDHWTVEFRAATVPPPPGDARIRGRLGPVRAGCVSLLSGGLDSAIGAADLIDAGDRIAFVSHNAKSGGAIFSSPSQRNVLAALRPHAAVGQFHHLRFRVNPPAPIPGVTAAVTTTRSRSIMFFALGLLVASALDAAQGDGPVPLVVPENGLISLNVPLTPARLGSWSTRTTHPHTLATLRAVMDGVGLATALVTPYATATKGEMLAALAARDRPRAEALIGATVSCAHPNQSRFLEPARRQPHCGTCVPCIIRRAAAQHAGVDDGRYSFDLPAELDILQQDRVADARAFLYALATRRRPALPLDINLSGPLQVETDDELRDLLRVYDAGMDEVARHLGAKIT
jgi:hypothetical protein